MLVLAQALVSRPKILVVDELSLGLAPIVVKSLVPTLEEVAAAGVGVLLIEQFAHVALGLARKAYVLEGGRRPLRGHCRGAAAQPRHPPLRLPHPGSEDGRQYRRRGRGRLRTIIVSCAQPSPRAGRRCVSSTCPNPGHPGDGEVVVRPEAVGLCGSDFHYFLGDIGSV